MLELVNDGAFYASKSNHRDLLVNDDSLLRAGDVPGLVDLVQVQLAYREAASPRHGSKAVNPGWANVLAHRFERLVRERVDGLVVL